MPLSQLTRAFSEFDQSQRLGSFAKRIMLFTGSIVVVLCGLLGWAMDRHLVISASEREIGNLDSAANRRAEAFESALSSYATSTRLLADLVGDLGERSPSPEGADSWQQQASGICRQMLINHEEFLQVRLIGESKGQELIRWDRAADGSHLEVRTADLQSKIEREYVHAGFACADGDIYISDIDLNREHGAIVTPDTPVLRVVAPVPKHASDQQRVIAVINIDLTRVFNRLENLTHVTRSVRIYDHQGRIIAHPEPTRAFAWDHGKSGGLLTDDLAAVSLSRPIPSLVTTLGGEQLLSGSARVQSPLRDGHNVWIMVMSQPYALVMSTIRNQRLLMGFGIFAAVGVLIVGVGILAKRMVAPLNRLSMAVTAFASGDSEVPLDTASSREVALLSTAFVHMRTAIIEQKTKVIAEITARKAAQEALVLRNRDLETLFFITSHDLREPLRAIRSFSEIVVDMEPNLSVKSLDFMKRIRRAGERMDTLMENLLQLSRAQREAIPDTALPSRNLVLAARDQHEAKISSTGAKLRIHDDLPVIFAHRIWATQAFSNLIGNALKFCQPGAVPEIDIKRYQPGPNDPPGPGLIFSDRGTGVDPDQRERIFGLFQRNVPRDIEGTGTGLAIVREVAHRHGGLAWVRENQDGGSEFIITFSTPDQPPRST